MKKTYYTKRALIKGEGSDPIILWFNSLDSLKACGLLSRICDSESELSITDDEMKKHIVEDADAVATLDSLSSHTKTVIEDHIIGDHKFTFDELASIARAERAN